MRSNLLITFPFPCIGQLREIEHFTAAKFACLVTDVEYVPENAFMTPGKDNPMIRCDSLPEFDFALFSKHINE